MDLVGALFNGWQLKHGGNSHPHLPSHSPPRNKTKQNQGLNNERAFQKLRRIDVDRHNNRVYTRLCTA